MPDHYTGLRNGEPRRQPMWVKVLAGVAVFVILLLAVALVFDASGQACLRRALNEARAGGGPVTLEELQAARRSWPDERNGALVILSIEPRLSGLSKEPGVDKLPMLGDAQEPRLGRRWSDEIDKEVAACLDGLSHELAAIDRLKDLEGGCFPLTIAANPLNTLLPNLSIVRSSIRLKNLQTTYRAMHGQTETLTDDVTIMHRHGQLLADEPTLISALVHVACDSLAIAAVEQTCNVTAVAPEQLFQVQQLLAAVDTENRTAAGLRGERGLFIGACEYFRSTGNLGSYAPTVMLPPKVPGVRGWLMRDQAAGVQMYNRLVRVAENPRKAIDEAKALNQELQKTSRLYILTHSLIPSLDRALELDLKTTAMARSAQVALASERYRLSRGQFPDQIDQLAPEFIEKVPVDPFDGKPLRYRMQAEALAVYSVGEDMTDDGGNLRSDPKKHTGPTDWGFTLLKPEYRGLPAEEVAPDTQEASATAPSQ